MDNATIDRARQMLEMAVRNDPNGISGVAKRLGRARSGLSMFLSDTYGANPGKLAAVVISHLDGWECPYKQKRITPDECRAIALIPAPTHRPDRLTHWRACQQCPGKPRE